MDIILAVVMVIVGATLIVSGIIEFKLICPVDWVGTFVGLIMVMTGVIALFEAL